MFEFEKPRIEIAEISDDNKYGKFVVEPLERGYGITLGNSLRRIMLSSLPGTAVSQVKIKVLISSTCKGRCDRDRDEYQGSLHQEQFYNK